MDPNEVMAHLVAYRDEYHQLTKTRDRNVKWLSAAQEKSDNYLELAYENRIEKLEARMAEVWREYELLSEMVDGLAKEI